MGVGDEEVLNLKVKGEVNARSSPAHPLHATCRTPHALHAARRFPSAARPRTPLATSRFETEAPG